MWKSKHSAADCWRLKSEALGSIPSGATFLSFCRFRGLPTVTAQIIFDFLISIGLRTMGESHPSDSPCCDYVHHPFMISWKSAILTCDVTDIGLPTIDFTPTYVCMFTYISHMIVHILCLISWDDLNYKYFSSGIFMDDKCAWVFMRKNNNLPKAWMTVFIGLLACIVTLVVNSFWYTPCSTR